MTLTGERLVVHLHEACAQTTRARTRADVFPFGIHRHSSLCAVVVIVAGVQYCAPACVQTVERNGTAAITDSQRCGRMAQSNATKGGGAAAGGTAAAGGAGTRAGQAPGSAAAAVVTAAAASDSAADPGKELLARSVLEQQAALAELKRQLERVHTRNGAMEEDNDALARYLETLKRKAAATAATTTAESTTGASLSRAAPRDGR